VAGDDTILVIMRDGAAARRFKKYLDHVSGTLGAAK